MPPIVEWSGVSWPCPLWVVDNTLPCQASFMLRWIVMCQRAFSTQWCCQRSWKEVALCMAKPWTAIFLSLGYSSPHTAPTLCSLTPGTILSTEETFYPEIQAFISYRNPSTTIRWQWISITSALQALVGLEAWRWEAALLSITHPPSQPTSCFVLDKYDQEAEGLLLFPDAFH